ncbi:Coenzyme F420-reducing hydrogenase, delta subunit [Desulfopila aestuarii DSM 18488]|uniref:Coenzyme F420-reducing hydrogenase, delta subunit n=2 Tax=Desulfopila aestuarii TaxID=231440 RepID=A0A1M7Y398_9BACT|nr:Coenzyme F420-reducing hydrogenase, delta subunit [Desulfopila aestuarii DSM 18488]
MLPCTGRIEEAIILQAFEGGADGVMVVGCLEGDCHYLSGNIRARARVQRVSDILESIGIGGDRVRMYNLSAGEGAKFAAYANEFSEHIDQLGPSIINQVRNTKAEQVTA